MKISLPSSEWDRVGHFMVDTEQKDFIIQSTIKSSRWFSTIKKSKYLYQTAQEPHHFKT